MQYADQIHALLMQQKVLATAMYRMLVAMVTTLTECKFCNFHVSNYH